MNGSIVTCHNSNVFAMSSLANGVGALHIEYTDENGVIKVYKLLKEFNPRGRGILERFLILKHSFGYSIIWIPYKKLTILIALVFL